jgi:hypothetical protein
VLRTLALAGIVAAMSAAMAIRYGARIADQIRPETEPGITSAMVIFPSAADARALRSLCRGRTHPGRAEPLGGRDRRGIGTAADVEDDRSAWEGEPRDVLLAGPFPVNDVAMPSGQERLSL